MKKLMEIKVGKNKIEATNNTVHKFDKNVVYAKCNFEYNYGHNLEGVKATLISQMGDMVSMSEKTITNDECLFELNNALFQEVGTLKNSIKLMKDEKELYINDGFIVHVVGKDSPSDSMSNLEDKNIVLKADTLKETIAKIVDEIGKDKVEGKQKEVVPYIVEYLENPTGWETLEFKNSSGTFKLLMKGERAFVTQNSFRGLPEEGIMATEESKSKITESLLISDPENLSEERFDEFLFIKSTGEIFSYDRSKTIKLLGASYEERKKRGIYEMLVNPLRGTGLIENRKLYKWDDIKSRFDNLWEQYKKLIGE